MSTMTTYLNVPFAEKDKVKALGARWDGAAKSWFAPKGADLSKFEQWISKKESIAAVGADGQESLAYSLSEYMREVSVAMTRAAPPAAWVSAEVSELRIKNGFWMFSLVEYDNGHREVSKAPANAFGDSARQIQAKLNDANVKIEPGIKVLLRVRAEMDPRYGFRLQVIDIDPKFTLGDMAAKMESIRRQLKKEGVYDMQRELPSPADFTRVAVIAPEGAAGLGDFMQEAGVLQSRGLTQFDIFNCVFQGERAPKAVLSALQQVHELFIDGEADYDAVVVIRGGGAVTDLAWLNDADLARQIATMGMPVFTGIGHERDNTSLDEVSHMRFDTPSKVINHIVACVITGAKRALQNMASVQKDAHHTITRNNMGIRATLSSIEAHATLSTQRSLAGAKGTLSLIEQLGSRMLEVSATTIESLAREVLGLSPAKTLDRGYAIVRADDGKVISTKAQAQAHTKMNIVFNDGTLAIQKAI